MILSPDSLNAAVHMGWQNPRNPLVWILLLPVAGLALNVTFQALLLRFRKGRSFMGTIAAGFGIGAVTTLVAHLGLAASLSGYLTFQTFQESLLEWLLLIAPAYAGLGYGYANFANLGNSSIRIRIYDQLSRAADGVPIEAIRAQYSETGILQVRLKRLSEGGDLELRHGLWHVKARRFVILGALIFAAKRLVLGRKSEFETP
jgi:hypothetical protein